MRERERERERERTTGDAHAETKLELKGRKKCLQLIAGNGMSAEGRNFKAARCRSTADLTSLLFTETILRIHGTTPRVEKWGGGGGGRH